MRDRACILKAFGAKKITMSDETRQYPVLRWRAATSQSAVDELAVEEPLEIRVNGQPIAVIMRTPGHDQELAAGFLLTEGIVQRGQHVELRAVLDEFGLEVQNVLEAIIPQLADLSAVQRRIFSSSSCGICGRMTIERIRIKASALNGGLSVDPAVLQALPEKLRVHQKVFSETGGLHGAMLFDEDGNALAVREDVGRHNAVDKLLGWAMMNNLLPLSRAGLFVSGRLSFEITQKALIAGISCVAGISAASSLAVELAKETGMTLIGFVREGSAVVYAD
jgi:FdhD protein